MLFSAATRLALGQFAAGCFLLCLTTDQHVHPRRVPSRQGLIDANLQAVTSRRGSSIKLRQAFSTHHEPA